MGNFQGSGTLNNFELWGRKGRTAPLRRLGFGTKKNSGNIWHPKIVSKLDTRGRWGKKLHLKKCKTSGGVVVGTRGGRTNSRGKARQNGGESTAGLRILVRGHYTKEDMTDLYINLK